MCYLLYAAVAGLLLLYTHDRLAQYALAARAEGTDWMVIAAAWEMVPLLWPLLLLAMLAASTLTLLALRHWPRKAS